MTSHPQPSTVIEMTADDDPVAGVRVTHAEGETLIVSMALGALPSAGTTVTLRWPAGLRGRYAREAVVVEIDENRVTLRTSGPSRVEQHRNYVRGGGGETVFLSRPGQPAAYGRLHDISEQSVRAYFPDVTLAEGDEFTLRVDLGPESVEAKAVALKVAAMAQSLPAPGGTAVELVAILDADEGQAQAIRRYVLRHQLLMRTHAVG